MTNEILIDAVHQEDGIPGQDLGDAPRHGGHEGPVGSGRRP